MVKCIVPVKLFGPVAGDYKRGMEYEDDSLAELCPDCFEPAQAKKTENPGRPPAEKAKKPRRK